MDTQLDILCRLQTLEGAFGITRGRWSNLRLARTFVADVPCVTLHSEWLSPKDTGFYRQAWKRIESITKNPADADDLLQQALSGVSSVSVGLCSPFRLAGIQRSKEIQSGCGTRRVLASSPLASYLYGRSLDILRHGRFTEPLDCEWDTIDDPDIEIPSMSETLLDMSNRHRIWEALGRYHRTSVVFRMWLASLDTTGTPPKFVEIANRLGISKVTVGTQFKRTVEYLASSFLSEGLHS